MLVKKALFYEGYDELKLDARVSPVEIFTSAADCDSCCAFRILKAMLESDYITYSVIAVAGFTDLMERVKRLPRDNKERAIVLLNCGGTENIMDLLGLDDIPGTRVFVFDSHRPLNLQNLDKDNHRVLVFRDERELTVASDEPIPPAADDGASVSDSDDDAGEEEDGEGHAARRQRVGEAGEANRTAVDKRERRRKRLEDARKRIEYYSRGSFYGRSAGCLLYDMAHQKRKDGLDHHAPLWYAIVSLTDQYIHQRLSHEAYTSTVLELAQRVSDIPSMDQPSTIRLEDGLTVKAFENRRIQYKQDYRFMLLRHWNLFESMLYSPYVAGSLRTWTDKGRGTLKQLLAEMGIPLEQCQDKFSHMPPATSEGLLDKFTEFAPKYGMTDLEFWSFKRSHGYKVRVSAADVVFAVTALIGTVSEEKGSWQDSFWRGVNALHESHWDDLTEGIQLAKSTQRAIMQQGGLVLLNSGFGGDGKKGGVSTLIQRNSEFQTVDLNASGGANASIFQQPMALLKLAIFLRDILVLKSRRPLVVISPADQNGLCTVVGVVGPPKLSDSKGNQFSLTFREAATEAKAVYVHDNFESSVIQLGHEYLNQFKGKLRECMRGMTDNGL